MDNRPSKQKETKAIIQGLYGALRVALQAGKDVGELLGPVGALCALAESMLISMEKMELSNLMAGHLSSRIQRQLSTLQALKASLARRHDPKGPLAQQLLPHLQRLGDVYTKVYEKLLEWNGTSRASLVMRLLSSQAYYEDFVRLETILTSCMCDLSACLSINQLMGAGYEQEALDPQLIQQQARDAIKEELQAAMHDILEAEVVCGSMWGNAQQEGSAAKLFADYGLDYSALKRKERKRWRQDKLRDLLIAWSDIKQVVQVSQDATSRVLHGTWQRHAVAVKEYLVQESAGIEEAVEREAYIMSLLRHPNIQQIYGMILEGGRGSSSGAHYGLVMELHPGGSLQDLIDKSRAQQDQGAESALPIISRRLELVLHTARGMAYLHSRCRAPIVHGSLRPSNVLIASNGRGVICGFGAASITAGTTLTLATQPLCMASRQDAIYTAPEVSQLLLDHQRLPPSTDVFSFGVLLYEVMTLQSACAGLAGDVTALLPGGERPAIPPELPRGLRFCIQQCWQQDPSRRPTFPVVVDMLEDVAASLAQG